jgi:hypothetical protein
MELCQRFATSAERILILEGLLKLRGDLVSASVVSGFQWLAGSFTEGIESHAGRPPRDIDVVTCYQGLSMEQQKAIAAAHPHLLDQEKWKRDYLVDHYFVDIAHTPLSTVESIRYWLGLFSHRRDGVWKGILRLELNTPGIDAAAITHLNAAKAEFP